MCSDIPTKGISTLYAKVGKIVGWASALGLIVLIVFSIRSKRITMEGSS